MAAGTSEQVVPEMFEECMDDDSSSGSDYCSIASDSCGVVEEVSFTKDVILNLIEDLEHSDEVSNNASSSWVLELQLFSYSLVWVT